MEMKYNLNKEIDRAEYKKDCKEYLFKRSMVEQKETKITRSQAQNRALHLLFTFVSNELNELGMEHRYFGVSGKEFSTRYTPDIVKNYFWRPIQIALFDIESTTKLNTKQMNDVTDVILKFFSDRGVTLEFPSMDSLID